MDASQLAFWSSASQLAAVLGLGVVIEARSSIARWAASSPGIRRWDSATLTISGITVGVSGMVSINVLLDGEHSILLSNVVVFSLTLALASLIISPIISISVATNYDMWTTAAHAWPLSASARLRRKAKISLRKQIGYRKVLAGGATEIDTVDREINDYFGRWKSATKRARSVSKSPERYTEAQVKWASDVLAEWRTVRPTEKGVRERATRARAALESEQAIVEERIAELERVPTELRRITEELAEAQRVAAVGILTKGVEVVLDEYRQAMHVQPELEPKP